MNYKKHFSIVFIPLLLWLSPAPATDLFDATSEMHITLEAPWRNLVRHVRKNIRYPAQLSFTGADGTEHTLDVEVEPRGNSRRFVTCDFPPIKVYFDTEQTIDTVFSGRKSLRLTTYCKKQSKYEQYAIKEFTAYRIYNEVTDLSIRARPLIIDYKDSESRSKPYNRFSYFTEDTKDVATRNTLKSIKLEKFDYREFDAIEIAYFSLFQYIIGNLDWSVIQADSSDNCCHNASVLGVDKATRPKFAIPFDFDSSGLVNPDYAAPPANFNLSNMRQRLYRGFCVHNKYLADAVTRFNQVKPEILAIFDSTSHISKSNRRHSSSYIEGFYEIINDPKRFQSQILDKCRG